MKNKYYTSRDPIKNYFPLPNEVFALGLSPGALAVYSYLMYIEDRTTYQCHASYKTIGKTVNMSPNTVRKYVAELEERSLIRTERTTVTLKDGRRRNGSLLYTILPPEQAVEQFNRQQLADYLAVDRSAMSAGLGKLRDEGILEFRKNHFHLLRRHPEETGEEELGC